MWNWTNMGTCRLFFSSDPISHPIHVGTCQTFPTVKLIKVFFSSFRLIISNSDYILIMCHRNKEGNYEI